MSEEFLGHSHIKMGEFSVSGFVLIFYGFLFCFVFCHLAEDLENNIKKENNVIDSVLVS